MSAVSERLREAALRPLAEPSPDRAAAVALLDDLAQPAEAGAEWIVARWDAVDAKGKRRPPWRWLLGIVLVMVSAWVLVGTAGEALRSKLVLWHLGYQGTWLRDAHTEPVKVITEGLKVRDKFLLLGDISQKPRSEQLRALCVSDPENPAWYAAYAFAYRNENHGAFPPDFLETAQRLDPDNSWFTYHAAGSAVTLESVKREKQSIAARQAGEAPAWKILDEEKVNQALALLRKAGTQKAFVNRGKEFIAERVPLLPQHDLVARVASGAYLIGYFGLDYDLRRLSDVVAAKAWVLGEAGDVPGFKQLLGDAEAFMKTFAGMENPTVIDGLVVQANADRLVWNLHAAAAKLGLTEEAARLGRIKEKLDQWSKERSRRRDGPEYAASIMRCSLGNEGAVWVRNMVQSPPPLADDDLKPGRMFENLLASRICSLAVWVLLGLGMAAVAVYRFCLPAWMLALARRLNVLLTPGDWAWLLGAGVLLPFAGVTALIRLTPLGGQDWGLVKGGGAVLLLGNFLTMALLLLVVPVLVARWRLGRRVAALGICRGCSRRGWLAVLAGLLFVPALALTKPPLDNLDYVACWKLVLIVPLLLIVLNALAQALVVRFTRQFSRVVVALTLLPVYACGMLLVMASMPVYQKAQADWERRDPMTELTSIGATRYEGAVATEFLKEVREALEVDAGH